MSQALISSQYLKVGGADVNAYALTLGTAVYSDAIKTNLSRGFAALLVELTASDDVDITFEVSLDGQTFFTPYNTSGTDIGKVFTTMTASRWVVFSPQISQYIRFKLDPDANSTITARYLQMEE